VSASSGAHRLSGIRWDDVQFDHGYDRWLAYGQSKTATVLFAAHLDTVGRQHGVRAFAVDPGSILTPLQRHLSKEEMVAAGWIDDHGNLADPSFKTRQQGAATFVWAATAPELEGLGGVYCADCDVVEPAATDAGDTGVSAHAIDPDEATRLWSLSMHLTNPDATTPPGHADAGAR
jgi:NAD(P)-dependent dehydrogenase (short-subunit alcohol dehydrogenase family)